MCNGESGARVRSQHSYETLHSPEYRALYNKLYIVHNILQRHNNDDDFSESSNGKIKTTSTIKSIASHEQQISITIYVNNCVCPVP